VRLFRERPAAAEEQNARQGGMAEAFNDPRSSSKLTNRHEGGTISVPSRVPSKKTSLTEPLYRSRQSCTHKWHPCRAIRRVRAAGARREQLAGLIGSALTAGRAHFRARQRRPVLAKRETRD
jgi:hypothetical protein